MLFMKPDMPLFFLHRIFPLLLLDSSEYLLLRGFELLLDSRGELFPSDDLSPAEKLADCLNDGVNIRGSGVVCAVCGVGRRSKA